MLLDRAIALRSSPGQLSVESSPARLSVQQRPPQLSASSSPPRLEVQSTPPRLEVDSTRPRAELGYLNYYAFLDDANSEGRRQAAAGIARRVDWGEAYKQVERDPQAILTQGTGPEPMRDWELAVKPRTPPSIRFTPGELRRQFSPVPAQIQVSPQPPIIEIEAVAPRISYRTGSLQIYLRPVAGNLGDLLDLSA